MEKMDSTQQALVETTTYWKKITPATPRGIKCFMINKPARSAVSGVLKPDDTFFTHYYPMPVFDPNETD